MGGIVLIVDDDGNLLDSLRRALHREPYTVIVTKSCEEALKMLDSMPIDVIMSDQEMPGMSGTDFLKQAAKLRPDITRFMLTGRATLDIALDAINKGGISRFFLKPCDPIDLMVAIRQGLQQHRLMVSAYQLLQKNARQSQLLGQLERLYPHITKVNRDSDGAIRIEDFHGDLDQLIEEIDACLKEE
jgi:DNA-binding NtrC family response regulator